MGLIGRAPFKLIGYPCKKACELITKDGTQTEVVQMIIKGRAGRR